MSRATEVAETLEQSKLMMSTAVREAAALLRQQETVIKQCAEALETCRIRSVSELEVRDVTPQNVTAALAAAKEVL